MAGNHGYLKSMEGPCVQLHLKFLSPPLQVKDFQFVCAGPAKSILFMCFQALKNFF